MQPEFNRPQSQRPMPPQQPQNQRPGQPLSRPIITPPTPKPPKKRMKKSVIITGVIVLVLVLAGAAFMMLRKQSAPQTGTTTQTKAANNSKTQAPPTSIRLIATGDWIAHDSVNTAAKQADGTYDYSPLVADFAPAFKKAGIRFCNDPILNGGKELGITGYPKFNSPTEFVTDMGGLGCNLANTASNHSFDFTQANITNSVKAWDAVPNMLAMAGENKDQAGHDTVHYFTKDGVKFAFLAYTTYLNGSSPSQNAYGVNVFSKDFAGKQITEAKANKADIIIASMRWGTEYATTVDGEQKADAQWLADQGVNLVLGHGSHTLQPVTELTGAGGSKTLVWYSLGNFLNTQIPPETLFNGLAVMDFDIATKAVSIKGYAPIYMHYEWTAAQAAAEQTNARHDLHLYYLEDATQDMIDKQQLKTTINAQKQRMTATLTQNGLNIPLLTSKDL